MLCWPRLLQACHATVEHANELWHAGRYATNAPEITTYEAIQYGFKRLIPLIIGAMTSGWHEMLIYIEHPEQYPWYNPEIDWPCLPPLNEFHPEGNNEDDSEKQVDTEEMVAVDCSVDIPL